MRTFLVFKNSINDEQRALVEVMDVEKYRVIMTGDFQNDDIAAKIEGFFSALDYLHFFYNRIDDTELTPENNLYWDIGFINYKIIKT